jgi:hypothetical protein
MKYLYFLITLASLIFFSAFTHAQNYQTFNSGRISYFEDAGHNVKSVRIDSVHFDTDSVLFPMGNIQAITEECFSPLGASWLGSKIVVRSNGENIFYNLNNESVTIKSAALLNESWIAYQSSGNLNVTAQVSVIDTMSFLGINDSIKIISFQVCDEFMTPINHTLNTYQLIISKNFGIIKTLNFYNFPDLTSPAYYFDEVLSEFNLCGISNPALGFQNFTWFDIYNFEVGDELHIRTFQEIPDFEASFANTYENLYIYKYLERTNSEDTITYKVERIHAYNFVTTLESGYVYNHDTITEKIAFNPDFNKLPGEVIEETYSISYLNMSNGFFKTKSDPRAYEFYDLAYESS